MTHEQELQWLKDYQQKNGPQEWCKRQEREIRKEMKELETERTLNQ